MLWWLFHLRQNCWSSSIFLSFPRFCTGQEARRWCDASVVTSVPRPRVRKTPLSNTLSIDRVNAISSSRDRLLTRTSSRTTYPTRKHAFRYSSWCVAFCSLRSYPRRGPRGRTTQAEAPQRSAEASKMAVRCKRVGRIALLAFSFVRVLVTVMDCLVGVMQEDAQAPRTRSCARSARTICATAARRPLGLRGGCCRRRLFPGGWHFKKIIEDKFRAQRRQICETWFVIDGACWKRKYRIWSDSGYEKLEKFRYRYTRIAEKVSEMRKVAGRKSRAFFFFSTKSTLCLVLWNKTFLSLDKTSLQFA